jgi:hypothetical protein
MRDTGAISVKRYFLRRPRGAIPQPRHTTLVDLSCGAACPDRELSGKIPSHIVPLYGAPTERSGRLFHKIGLVYGHHCTAS